MSYHGLKSLILCYTAARLVGFLLTVPGLTGAGALG
jgi:hypothetical protein